MTIVTVPTDYSTIQDACNAIVGLVSNENKGTIYILNGEYEELGNYNLGLYIHNFINLIGESKEGVIIYPPSGEANGDGIFYPGYNAQHENLTIYARTANHYALHQDHYSPWITWKNCSFYHENPAKAAIGGGGRGNQIVTFIDCEVTNGTSSVHGDVYSRTISSDFWQWNFKNCSLLQFGITDFIEYKDNIVSFERSIIPTISYSINNTYYDQNNENPLFNQGYIRNGIYVFDYGGNTINTLTGTTFRRKTNLNRLAVGTSVKI